MFIGCYWLLMSRHPWSRLALSIQLRHLYRIFVWFNLNILTIAACGSYNMVTAVLMARVLLFLSLFELAWEDWIQQRNLVLYYAVDWYDIFVCFSICFCEMHAIWEIIAVKHRAELDTRPKITSYIFGVNTIYFIIISVQS